MKGKRNIEKWRRNIRKANVDRKRGERRRERKGEGRESLTGRVHILTFWISWRLKASFNPIKSFGCVCVRVGACVFVCVCESACVGVGGDGWVSVCVCVNIFAMLYASVCVFVCLYFPVCMFRLRGHVCICICIYTCKSVCMCTCM